MPFDRLFDKITKHLIDSIKFNFGLNYVFAAVFTLIIVSTGLDALWYKTSVNNPIIYNAGFISAAVGGLLPILFPLGFYLYGRYVRNKKFQVIGLALGQAALLGLIISSFIKLFTGRIAPHQLLAPTVLGGFRFGFDRGGAFNGWPSSHTTVAFAMATALATIFPEKRKIILIAYTYASIIGLGVSLNIHWFSDVVAGALIGYAIGKGVGADFKKLLPEV
ncbi:MAG: phosphoesterase PA-phosphatase related protein [Candidatus Doudnabacteria bacterium]|nr:phosphoesterase PA-phosphatase related protein [Candidatus Doudnabacteria bacterium]